MKTISQKIRQLAPFALALSVMATLPAAAQTYDQALTAHERGDYATALRGFRTLAEHGEADAQASLGLMYARGHAVPLDYAEAARWFRRSAEQGNADAQFGIGLMHATGEGMPQDHVEAVRWFRRSAEQGHAGAQNNLGVVFDKGRGVPQDHVEAVRWFRRSAEQGHAGAQNNLGLMYVSGNGVAQNFVQAHKWLNLAASRLGSDPHLRDRVVNIRDRVAARLSPTEIAEAQRLTREWRVRGVATSDRSPNP